MIEGPEVPPIRVCLERNAQSFKGSIQVLGRKKSSAPPHRMSEDLVSANRSALRGGLSWQVRTNDSFGLPWQTSMEYLGSRMGRLVRG